MCVATVRAVLGSGDTATRPATPLCPDVGPALSVSSSTRKDAAPACVRRCRLGCRPRVWAASRGGGGPPPRGPAWDRRSRYSLAYAADTPARGLTTLPDAMSMKFRPARPAPTSCCDPWGPPDPTELRRDPPPLAAAAAAASPRLADEPDVRRHRGSLANADERWAGATSRPSPRAWPFHFMLDRASVALECRGLVEVVLYDAPTPVRGGGRRDPARTPSGAAEPSTLPNRTIAGWLAGLLRLTAAAWPGAGFRILASLESRSAVLCVRCCAGDDPALLSDDSGRGEYLFAPLVAPC